jgi:Ca2+-binding RTX toxin-like protein
VSDGRGGSDAQTWTVEVINTQEVVRGSAGADQLVGTPLPEMIDGLGGDDRIAGLGGDDLLTGGSGIDSAVYSSPRSQYRVTEHGTKVSALSGGEGTDTLKEIERLVFSDSALAFDIAGHAGTVARCLGAVFGKTSVENTAYVGIGLRLLDQGVTNNDLMQLALESRLGATFSPAAEVELLYRNIAGRAPDAGELAYWSSELAHGDFDMVSLAQMAAGLDLNALNIGLAGLAESGLPYDAA